VHHVYILRSAVRTDQIYIGATSNLDQRLIDHNAGKSPHTSKFAPWSLEFSGAFPNRETAYAFERYLKSHSGRAFANKRLICAAELAKDSET